MIVDNSANMSLLSAVDQASELAASLRSPVVLFLGEDEIASDTVAIRDLETKEKASFPISAAIRYLDDRYFGGALSRRRGVDE